MVPEFGSSALFPHLMGIHQSNELLLLGKVLTETEAVSAKILGSVYSSKEELRKEVINKAILYCSMPMSMQTGMLYKKMMKKQREKINEIRKSRVVMVGINDEAIQLAEIPRL